jgi:erythromycin esterase-like protein
MKTFTFLFLFLLVCSQCIGQSILKDFIKNNSIEIKSITPSDTTYQDLELIGNSIGNSRVVMLGEQDHGDGATFLAKSRLIKFLHEKLGFNILAFEGDLYSLNKGWDLTSTSSYSIDSLIQKNVYSIWTKCFQCAEVFSYLKQESETSFPLILTGFDSQLTGSISQQKLLSDLLHFLDTSKISYFQIEQKRNDFIDNLASLIKYYKGAAGKSPMSAPSIQSFITTIDTIINQVRQKYSDENFYIATMNSIHGAARQMIAELNKDNFGADEVRDKQMAENLKWLVDVKYSKEKIIVWAANSHIMKNYFKSSKPPSMGYIFTKQTNHANETYVLGFTGQTGKSGRISLKPYNVPSPAKNSIEQWLSEQQLQYAFVDFKTFNNQYPDFADNFSMKWIHWQNEKADWTKVFDGVFYIKEMQPCKKGE